MNKIINIDCLKKIIPLIFLTIFLFSCQAENNQVNNITREKTKQKIETEIIEEIEKNITLENEKKYKNSNKNKLKIDWSNEKIAKLDLDCVSWAFNLGDSDEKMKNFRENKETKLLQKKVDDFNERHIYNDPSHDVRWFSYFVSEYCKNKESDKYIFWTQDKPIFRFWRYDKKNDTIEPAIFKYKTFDYIWWMRFISWYNIKLEKYYKKYAKENKFNWFWKRVWNKILIKDFARPIESTYKELKDFLKEKNSKYCYNWLTPKWNKAICFADVYYSYDFIKNILTEDKICTYYIDDYWNIKTLENCKEFSY